MKAIEIQNIAKRFGSTVAVNNASFDVDSGQVFGFLGPNGAGKTTTIRCIMDFIRPDEGSVKIFGKDSQANSVEIKKDIGYLSGEIDLYEHWTGKQHIRFFQKLNGKEDISDELVRMLGFDVSKKAKNLSSGNKQKLGLILAFMAKPKLIILDEPTTGLDPILQNRVYDLIQKVVSEGSTVLMSSHNLAEVDKVCDHVAIIKSGEIIAKESILQLKSKRLYSVHVVGHEGFESDSLLGEDVELVRTFNHTAEYKVKGDINDFISKLSGVKLKDVSITQARLEDIFLEYYQN